MKTMTCKQLGGPCDHQHQGQDADEVIKAQDRHLKEMVAGGDTAHAPALKEKKAFYWANRLMKSSAVWATSRQPWSIVREWPRFGIFTISVTAGLRICRL